MNEGQPDAGINVAVAAFNGERVARAFVEETSIKLALDSQQTGPLTRHTEIGLDKGGVTHIIDQVGDKVAAKSTGYAEFAETQDENDQGDTKLRGLIVHGKDNSTRFTVGMNQGHNESVTFEDRGSNPGFKSVGSCASDADGKGVCNFSITDGDKTLATIVGDRTYADGVLKTHLNLFSPDNAQTKLGSLDIDMYKVTTDQGPRIVVDVAIAGKQ
jgi:hypothetical protein